jgi:uncharacterized protein with HEPN domain
MRLESKKYLYDIQRAAALLTDFTKGKALADYSRDSMLRAAVEREFEIIGEALARLARLVWDVLTTKLPVLRREVDELLEKP